MGQFCQHTAIVKDHIKIIRNINSNVSDCLSLFETSSYRSSSTMECIQMDHILCDHVHPGVFIRIYVMGNIVTTSHPLEIHP